MISESLKELISSYQKLIPCMASAYMDYWISKINKCLPQRGNVFVLLCFLFFWRSVVCPAQFIQGNRRMRRSIASWFLTLALICQGALGALHRTWLNTCLQLLGILLTFLECWAEYFEQQRNSYTVYIKNWGCFNCLPKKKRRRRRSISWSVRLRYDNLQNWTLHRKHR